MCTKWQICIIKTVGGDVLTMFRQCSDTRRRKIRIITRHENFHGNFSLCAEYLIRSIGHGVFSRLKVFTDYSQVCIGKKIQT